LKFRPGAADGWHAAITVESREVYGTGATRAHVHRLIKESIMFFAPVVRTRAHSPAFRSFDRSFERFVNDNFFANTPRGFNVEQDDKAWTVTLDAPGIAKEELAISIEGNIVRLETKPEAKRQLKAAYELPQEIDVDATTAKLENGVLSLVLAKKQPVSNARTIEVK
jgi:HSP20 family molecular chaperone IbpA